MKEAGCNEKESRIPNKAGLSATGLTRVLSSNVCMAALLLALSSVGALVVPSLASADPVAEVCNGEDDDEDGTIDNGSYNGSPVVPGDPCSQPQTNPNGTCYTGGGTIVCGGGQTWECQLPPGITATIPEPEILAANDSSCFDTVDNDCDGLTDYADNSNGYGGQTCNTPTELFCNGLDDDNDGLVDDGLIGASCDEGIGICARTGTEICDPDDLAQINTICSVSAGNPKSEDTPGVLNCIDGDDNDCDGLVDLEDPQCQLDLEICDGLDNTGNGDIDEGFPLGDTCTAGIGACEVTGEQVCNALGDATQCNVLAGIPGVEGPSGPTCSDGIDNDCDGLTDDSDPNCFSDDIAVSCRLLSLKTQRELAKGPLKRRKKGVPGTSCEERFVVEIDTNRSDYLSAEVMGLNPDGSLIDISPYPSSLPVQDGDELHLNSRVSPEDWKVNAKGRFIDVFAPVPLVRATVDTGQNKVEAFCSPIPWMNVDQPSGQDQVVSLSEGSNVQVVVPIPRVDPSSLEVVVDGDFIFDSTHLNIDPGTDFPNPGAPIGGTIDINGQLVTVSDLVVDVAGDANYFGEDLSKNSLTMTLENLGGGGHIVVVNGDPRNAALPDQTSSECHLDDVLAAGTVAVFGITIEEPDEGEKVPLGGTTVEATVAHGRDIASAMVQGVPAETVGPQTCGLLEFDAFGESWSVESCVLDIFQVLPQTDLTGPLALGTIDIGQNVLVVGAEDDRASKTYAKRGFISGLNSTSTPGISALSQAARESLEKKIAQRLNGAFEESPSTLRPLDIEVTRDAVNFNLAFTFGASEAGLNGFFGAVCDDALAEVQDAIDTALGQASFDPVSLEVDGACDPTVRLTGLDFQFVPPSLSCTIDAVENLATVDVNLPHIDFEVGVEGKCRDEVLGVCISEVKVNFNLDVDIDNFGVEFDINETLALEGGTAPADIITGTVDISSPGTGVEINCLSGALADFLDFITFGLVDFEGDINDALAEALDFDQIDVADALRAASNDPLAIQQIQLDDTPVQADGLEIQQEILAVEITGQEGLDDGTGGDGIKDGLTGTIGANFTVPLAELAGFEAAVLETPPAPLYPLNAKEIFFAPSDDIFNLLFAALGLQGLFVFDCVDPGVTLGDTLPADSTACNALVGVDQFQTDVLIGRCQGAIGTDCTSLTNPGQAFLCADTQAQLSSRNISTDTALLFCANQPIPPRTLIRDDLATADKVEADIHVSDMAITIALDKDGNGAFDPDFLFGPGCLGFGDDTTVDCKWADACFDFNFDAEFTLGTTTAGTAQIVRTVTGVTDSVGTECGGGFNLGAGSLILQEAGASGPVTVIQDNVQDIVRIFQALGLDLGGLQGLENPTIIALDVPSYSDPDCSDCAEYVGVTGDLELPSP